MLKSKALHVSFAGAFGATAILASMHFMPCTDVSAILLNIVGSALPCPAAPAAASVGPSTSKVTLMLVIPQGTVVRVGDSFPVTLFINASGTPVNALDATIEYPSSSVRLISNDESISSFAIHLDQNNSDVSNETIQIQPNPGIASLAPVAKFTFTALRAGIVTFTLASSSEVLANDGLGTDVLGSVEAASITIE